MTKKIHEIRLQHAARESCPSHGVSLADAFIAASAALHQAQLVTLKARHFPMLEVEVPYRKPE